MGPLDIWRGSRPQGLLSSWDEFGREFERMFSEMDRFLTPMKSRGLGEEEAMLNLSYGVDESDNNYIISFDIPGVAKEDLNIEVQGNQLVVSGERRQHEEHREGSYYRSGRRYGKFRQSFTLPAGTDTGSIEARYENGVLQLAIPKSEEAKPKRINIEEGRGGFLKKLIGKDKDKEQQDEGKKVS